MSNKDIVLTNKSTFTHLSKREASCFELKSEHGVQLYFQKLVVKEMRSLSYQSTNVCISVEVCMNFALTGGFTVAWMHGK